MMNDIERKFLLAVERGDISTLKALLVESRNGRLDINCQDPLARNALIIAIDNENLEIVKLLIEAGVRIGDSLLYAIDECFVEAVELLLDYEEINYKIGHLHSWEHDRENSSFSADMTPLILAAHRNNFEIIKMLLDRRVSPLPDPHDPRCDCTACCRARSDDCLRHSRARINAYRALASPCLMALSSPDPLLMAFEMSLKLENLAKLEPEYKEDYLKLRAQCQTFATRLLDHTRTSKELEILLNYSDEFMDDDHHDHLDEVGELCCQGSLYEMSLYPGLNPSTSGDSSLNSPAFSSANFFGPNHHGLSNLKYAQKASMISLDSVTGRHESYESHMRLARLRLAIHCKQKTFCAHPNIQELLATMWYENLPGFRRKNPLAQIAQVLFIGLMFPIYSMAYLVVPNTDLGRYIKKPFIKFICHSASYITFLIVLILASQRVEAFYSWPTVVSLFVGQPQTTSVFADPNITRYFEFYASQIGNTQPSAARGLDNLGKIFERLPPSSKKRGTLPSPIEIVILIWVISLIWAEIKQLKALGMNYYKSDMWNTLDSVASGFYIGTIVLRCVSYFQSDEHSIEVARERWEAYDPTLLSEGLFAAATIFSSLKLVYIFSVNPYLGPLQISLGRMIIDILRFSWIYMLVLFSFACGMNQLLWYYADLERHQCMNITNYMLVQYYNSQQELAPIKHSGAQPSPATASLFNGSSSSSPLVADNSSTTTTVASVVESNLHELNTTDEKVLFEAALNASLEDDSTKPPVTMDDSCRTWRHFSNVFESSQTLFWATFGLVDLENFELTGIRQYTRFWALLMFGCYCFINVIVVLNLLIAMMNHSYVKISKKSDIEWKFARTRLWMSYFDTGSTVPAPFNIVPSMKSLATVAQHIWSSICWLGFYIITLKLRVSSVILGKTERPANAQTAVAASSTSAPPLTSTAAAATTATATARFAAAGKTSQQRNTNKRLDSIRRRRGERNKMNCYLTASYRNVMRLLVRRYLVSEQRLLERKRELTEAKLNRWAKLNAFE